MRVCLSIYRYIYVRINDVHVNKSYDVIIVCRWSLIAGRLPGRTANDVKNFWNTKFQKKLTSVSYQLNDMVKRKELFPRKQDSTDHTNTSTVVIKPLPRTLSKGTRLPCYNFNPTPSYYMNSPLPQQTTIYNNDFSINNNNINRLINKQPSPATPPFDQDGIEWWKNLLAEIEIHGQEKDSSDGLLMVSSSNLQNLDAQRDLIWKTRDQSSAATTETTGLEDGQGGWSDIWGLLNSDYN